MPRSKKHPAHKVRVIRRIVDDEVCGWSIYPEQLPAMESALMRAVDRAAKRRLAWGEEWRRALVKDCLRSIGLETAKEAKKS